MSTMIKRYAVLTPFDLPGVVAGILALNHIDAAVVMTGSGAVAVRELAASQYDERGIRNTVGPDEFEEEDSEVDPSDSAPTVAASLSKLSRFGVVLLNVDLGTGVGIEAGVSGTMRARRFLSDETGEEASAGALLNVLDSLAEKLILGRERPEDHDATLSNEVTIAMITKMARARNSRGEGKGASGLPTDGGPEDEGSDGDSLDGGKSFGGSERRERQTDDGLMTLPLQLLSAVDVADGRSVRLTRGEASFACSFGDPMRAVADFVEAGVAWIHLADINAAFGHGSNRALLTETVRETQTRRGVYIEWSGGVHDKESLLVVVASGAARVNPATGTFADLEWAASAIERFGPQVAVCLDARGDVPVARGEPAEIDRLQDVLPALEEAGYTRYIVADVAHDGAINGSNTELLRKVAAAARAPVVASGGVSGLQDIRNLRELAATGVDSAIAGKALYEGAFTLVQAIEAAGEQNAGPAGYKSARLTGGEGAKSATDQEGRRSRERGGQTEKRAAAVEAPGGGTSPRRTDARTQTRERSRARAPQAHRWAS